MGTPILALVSSTNTPSEVWRKQAAAAEAALRETTNQIIADRKRLAEAIWQAQEQLRHQPMAMAMPAGILALRAVQDARREHRAKRDRWLSVPPDDLCTR